MKLKEYFAKYDLNRTAFAYKCGVPYSSLMAYISGKHRPRQEVAEEIEKLTDNLVTVEELRGKDERRKAHS